METVPLLRSAPLAAPRSRRRRRRAGPAVRRTPVVEVVAARDAAVVNISAESIVREVDPFFGGLFGGPRRTKALARA